MFAAKICITRPSLSSAYLKYLCSARKCFFSSLSGLNINHVTIKRETMDKNISSDIKSLDYSALKDQKLRRTKLHVPYVSDFLVKDPILQKKYDFLYNKDTNLLKTPSNDLKEYDLTHYLPRIEYDFSKENDVEHISMITGMSQWEIKKLIQKPLVIRRVVNQTRKGKIPSMYSLAIVGNGTGMIGLGEGKSKALRTAIKKSCLRAMKNMYHIPRYENRTIYGNVRYKFHAVLLELRSRPRGKFENQ